MDRRARIEGPGGSVQTSHRLQRSRAIALFIMADRPYFRAAGGQADGCARADCQEQFDAAVMRKRAVAVHPTQPPGAQGLGVFGDSMLASDLAG